MTDVPTPIPPDSIAIVGMAGRFAAAADVDALWHALRDGRELITHYDREDLIARGVPCDVVDHRDYVPSRGALPDPLDFDAQFFGYSAREAAMMDPQQRLLLETAWHTAEDAGLPPLAMPGRVGVFAATAPPTYTAAFPPPVGVDPMEVQLGNDPDFAASRVSYKLGLDGPSIGVSTACSSGLTAVHLACQSLMNGDADTVFALAASVRLPADRGVLRAPGSILSRDGHCRPFAADADGTVEADGSAGVLLRRLDDALADGDRIHAVIIGSAIGNDGGDRVGFTAPGVKGQRRIIEAALRYADLSATDVGYIETHGTGTRLGDPVETRSLAAVYGAADRTEPCRFGSLKSNLGHLNHVAGIAGLIKVVLSLKHGELTPSLHLDDGLNPELDLADGRLRVQSHLEPWPAAYSRRIAAVSSFGMGGSGAHAIVAAAPATRVSGHQGFGAPEVLPLSARSPEGLAAAAGDLAGWLARHPDALLSDVGHTLRAGRTALPYRTAVVGHHHEEVITALTSARIPRQPVVPGESTVLIFPGQGAEEPGMAATLYQAEPMFRRYLEDALDCLPGEDRVALRSYLLDADCGNSGTALAQPALFATEYAKAQCWEAAGLEVNGMIGHSVGEFAAACLADVLSFEDAMRLVAARGRLVATTGPGAMLAVRLSPEELRDRLRDRDEWDLAAHNADVECVLSGETAVVDDIAATLRSDGIGTMRLHVPHAFHSHRLDPVLTEFAALVAKVERRTPTRPYVSCVTGRWISGDDVSSVDHWVRHLRGTVRFAEAVRTALSAGTSTFIQLGPGRMATSHVRRTGANAVVFVGDDLLPVPGVAQAWTLGAKVRWPVAGRRIALPGYPFQRRTYVLGPPAAVSAISKVPPLEHLQPDDGLVADALSPVVGTEHSPAHAPTNRITTRHPRPPMATPYRPASNIHEAAIVDLVEDLLDTEGIGIDDDFAELGWNSLLAASLASRLATDLNKDVSQHVVLDAPTAARLAAAVADIGDERDQAG